MRSVRGTLLLAASSFGWAFSASAQETEPPPPEAPPPRSVIIDPSAPSHEEAPEEAPTEPSVKPTAAPPRQEGEDGPDENAKKDEDESEESAPEDDSTFVYAGLGMAVFGLHPVGSYTRSWDEFGVAVTVGGRHEVHPHIAIGGSLTWGLTTWSRTQLVWDTARELGRWTKNAYINVTEWVGEGKAESDNPDDYDTRFWRGFAAFYAYIGLLFPYAATAVMYVVGPVFATSHFTFDLTSTFHLLETKKGPFVESGLGVIAYIHPEDNEMRAGVGPVLGFGYDFGSIGFAAKGTFSPRYLHAETNVYRTDIYTGQVVLRVQ